MIRFFKDEEALGTVEIVIIIAVLVGIALIFRKQIFGLFQRIMGQITGAVDSAGDLTATPRP